LALEHLVAPLHFLLRRRLGLRRRRGGLLGGHAQTLGVGGPWSERTYLIGPRTTDHALKRNLGLVAAGVRRVVGRFALVGVGGRAGRAGGPGGGPIHATALARLTALSRVEHLHHVHRQLVLRPLLAGLLVVPLVEAQSAFEVRLRPLAEEALDSIGQVA